MDMINKLKNIFYKQISNILGSNNAINVDKIKLLENVKELKNFLVKSKIDSNQFRYYVLIWLFIRIDFYQNKILGTLENKDIIKNQLQKCEEMTVANKEYNQLNKQINNGNLLDDQDLLKTRSLEKNETENMNVIQSMLNSDEKEKFQKWQQYQKLPITKRKFLRCIGVHQQTQYYSDITSDQIKSANLNSRLQNITLIKPQSTNYSVQERQLFTQKNNNQLLVQKRDDKLIVDRNLACLVQGQSEMIQNNLCKLSIDEFKKCIIYLKNEYKCKDSIVDYNTIDNFESNIFSGDTIIKIRKCPNQRK